MQPNPSPCIAVIGAGAWGTALANAAARAHRKVWLWTHRPEHAESLRKHRMNMTRLPGIPLESEVHPTNSFEPLGEAQIVLLAVPAQITYDVGKRLVPFMRSDSVLLTCAKGIAQDSGLLMTDIIQKIWPQGPYGILSGPSFATEVAQGLPTAVVIACSKGDDAHMCASALTSPTFRIYHSVDLIGVALGGAIKNVLAIAAGMVQGRSLGENARSALITRGFAEMNRFARACGAQSSTLMGLSGLGDVILTCSSSQSRNFALGHHLGSGGKSENSPLRLAEGAFTAPILLEKARTLGIDMPIVAAVVAILSHKASLDSVIHDLLERPIGPETI